MSFDESDNRHSCKAIAETSLHASLNIVLLLVLVVASAFKLYRSHRKHYIDSISSWYLFFGLLFNISQTCIGIIGSQVELPSLDCARFVAADGLGVLNPLLLILLSAAILVYSFVLFIFASYSESPDAWRQQRPPLSPAGRGVRPGSSSQSLKPLLPYAVLILYVLLFLIPTLVFPFVPPKRSYVIVAIYIKLTLSYHLITLPILTVVQFLPQLYLLWRRRQDLGRTIHLDTLCFATDILLLILVGLSWRWFIFETQPWFLHLWYGIAHLLSWQHWAGCMWVDYVATGLGTLIVLVVYVWLCDWRRRLLPSNREDEASGEYESVRGNNETEPLLPADG